MRRHASAMSSGRTGGLRSPVASPLPSPPGPLGEAMFPGPPPSPPGNSSSDLRAERPEERGEGTCASAYCTSASQAARTSQGLTVPYARASLFEGLSEAWAERLREMLNNRFASSSWRKIKQGVKRWKTVAEVEEWPYVIASDDPSRGGKLVTFVMEMVDETELVFKSIELYLWGMRTWQTLQGQADPVFGVMGWESFMNSVKMLTWEPSTPRKMTPLDVLEAIIDDADEDDFHDVQMVHLLLTLVYTFSRSECPLPKSRTGRESFDPGVHWRIIDFDVKVVGGRRVLMVRFQAIKQDPRVERPEAAGNADWAILGEIPGSKWCPVMWATRFQKLVGVRRDKDGPHFVSPHDRSESYLYGTALDHYHRAQERVGVPKDELTSFHGLRVLGYNKTKAALGEDLAVAHGLWKSVAHKRYDRFDLGRVVLIPSAVAGVVEPVGGGGVGDAEANVGPPPARMRRGRASALGALSSDEDEGEEEEEGGEEDASEGDEGASVVGSAISGHSGVVRARVGAAQSSAGPSEGYWAAPSTRRGPTRR